MRLLAALATLLVLTGCDTLPKRYEVPVPVACVKRKPARPDLVDRAALRALPDGELVAALGVHYHLSEGYIAELEAVVDGCAKLPS